jgi:hypothetical protein
LRWLSINWNNPEGRIQAFDQTTGSGNGQMYEESRSIGNTSGGKSGRKPSDFSETKQLFN